MNYRTRSHIVLKPAKNYVETIKKEIKNKTFPLIDCSLGVNPYGYSKKVQNHLNNISLSEFINEYPDSKSKNAKKAICNMFSNKITSDNIRIGAGSAGLIEKFCKLFIDKDTYVLGFSPQFTGFITCVKAYGGIYDGIPLKKEANYKFSAENLIKALKPKHTVIYLDNPSNPSGQLISLSDISKICEVAKVQNTTVFVDEAYLDFVKIDYSSVNLISKYPNLVVVRSISKGFGMAGLRAGYMISNEKFLKLFDTIDQKFLITSIAEELLTVALSDMEFLENSAKEIAKSKREIMTNVKKLVIWETTLEVPIFTIMHPCENIDLCEEFAKYNVISTSASGFYNMNKNMVRIRVPKDVHNLIDVINLIENSI